MNPPLRIVHYVNQFFGQIGGEDKAGVGPQVVQGPVGPGRLLQQLLGNEGEVVATAICGDNYFAENADLAADELVRLIEPFEPQLLIAGPAFNAGRYGPACGRLCQAVQRELGIPAITGMYEENPGADLYRREALIVKTADSARGMAEGLTRMLSLARKVIAGEELGSPAEDGYFPRGVFKTVASNASAAERAVDMLLAKIGGKPFEPELRSPTYDRVTPPPPIADLKTATIAIVTDGGLVPKGNPERMPAAGGSRIAANQIAGLDNLTDSDFEAVHGGYDTHFINEDPDRLAPVDILREMEREGAIGKLLEVIYATAGLTAPMQNARRTGATIAEKLKEHGVNGVILTST
jgi:glycine reductase complex component B subunit gamma